MVSEKFCFFTFLKFWAIRLFFPLWEADPGVCLKDVESNYDLGSTRVNLKMKRLHTDTGATPSRTLPSIPDEGECLAHEVVHKNPEHI